eukprot:TRINITY_DN19648_c0_g2_i1.p1 TRINITY_DN19648_c0_g2~~TRINITY_DN19648_c0_g2_i1.p1  ORF type:complete len:424 (-),score=60.25 TRINITY_DN19648_c0_g2_i1:110-1312(-)
MPRALTPKARSAKVANLASGASSEEVPAEPKFRLSSISSLLAAESKASGPALLLVEPNSRQCMPPAALSDAPAAFFALDARALSKAGRPQLPEPRVAVQSGEQVMCASVAFAAQFKREAVKSLPMSKATLRMSEPTPKKRRLEESSLTTDDIGAKPKKAALVWPSLSKATLRPPPSPRHTHGTFEASLPVSDVLGTQVKGAGTCWTSMRKAGYPTATDSLGICSENASPTSVSFAQCKSEAPIASSMSKAVSRGPPVPCDADQSLRTASPKTAAFSMSKATSAWQAPPARRAAAQSAEKEARTAQALSGQDPCAHEPLALASSNESGPSALASPAISGQESQEAPLDERAVDADCSDENQARFARPDVPCPDLKTLVAALPRPLRGCTGPDRDPALHDDC